MTSRDGRCNQEAVILSCCRQRVGGGGCNFFLSFHTS